LLGTGVFLGLGVPLAKLAVLAGVHPLQFTALPTAVAALVLIGFACARQGRPAAGAALLRFGLIAGVFGHALPMSALYALSHRAGASFAALAFTLPAVFTLSFSLLLRLERPNAWRVAAVALGCAGALLLLTGRGLSLQADGLSAVLVLAIPACIGATNIYRARHMPTGVSGDWMAAATLAGSALILLGVSPLLGAGGLPASGTWHWLALQALTLVAGYLLYFALQRRADAVTFSFMGYVSMLTGVAAGAWGFGEQLPASTLPALALLAAGLLLIRRSPPPPGATRSRP